MSSLGIYAIAKRYDPTHTTVLRNAFARNMVKRFIELKRTIKVAVVDQDCFGLDEPIQTFQMVPPGRRAFSFMRDPEKIEAFMRWLKLQEERGLLSIGQIEQIGQAIAGEWTNLYIFDAYKRGVMRARQEMKRGGLPIPDVPIEAIMGLPMHLDRVGVLFTRVFSELQGITAQMDTLISQVLAQGMIDGDGSRLIARKLLSVIDGKDAGTLGITDRLGRFIPPQRRAEMLTRTEVIRAYHLGAIQEYRNWRVEGVYVLAEWVTAGDDRVCEKCHSLEGKRFTLEEIEPMIPFHPQCRCLAMPYLAELEKFYKREE